MNYHIIKTDSVAHCYCDNPITPLNGPYNPPVLISESAVSLVEALRGDLTHVFNPDCFAGFCKHYKCKYQTNARLDEGYQMQNTESVKTWLVIAQNCWDCSWKMVMPAVGKKLKINRTAQRTHEKITGHRIATGFRIVIEGETKQIEDVNNNN